MGDAGCGAQLLPRSRRRSVRLRRTARGSPAQAHCWRPHPEVLGAPATLRSIHKVEQQRWFAWSLPRLWLRCATRNVYLSIGYQQSTGRIPRNAVCSFDRPDRRVSLSLVRASMVDRDLNLTEPVEGRWLVWGRSAFAVLVVGLLIA